jgi:hypothetical protein
MHDLSISELGDEWFGDGDSSFEQEPAVPAEGALEGTGLEDSTQQGGESGEIVVEGSGRGRKAGFASRLGRWRPRRLLERIHIHI